MVFSKEDACTRTLKWGDKEIPRVVSYCYLGITFGLLAIFIRLLCLL